MKTKESLPSYELSLYEKLYEKEIAYRNNFSDKVYKSITVIISLLGANVWLITKFVSVFNSECCFMKSIKRNPYCDQYNSNLHDCNWVLQCSI